MAFKGTNVEVNLSLTADTDSAKRKIADLQQTLLKLMSSANKPKDFTLTKDLQEASHAASSLRASLNSALDVNTGKLDLSKFSQSLKASGKTLAEYHKDLAKLGPEGEEAFAKMANAISSADTKLKNSTGLLGQLEKSLINVAKYQLSTSVLNAFTGAISKAYSYAQDLNESLNKIQIVTGNSSAQMANFADRANKAAQALSTTTKTYTDAALIYAQQGLGTADIEKRTAATIKMAQATGDSATTVSSYMTAIWNNFHEGSKSLENYADSIVALGASTASSSAEIAEGLSKFASIAETVGLSYDYATSSLATLVAKTRQSADTVGTALKTIFSRLQGLSLGDTLDDGVNLNKYSTALQKAGISIMDSNGQLKAMDRILDEMGAKWQTLNQAQQTALGQTVAGVRQYTQLVALMNNWSDVQKNISTAKGASGTLDKQAEIYASSWEAAQKRVRAAAEEIYSQLIDDDFFIKMNDNLAETLKTISKMIDGLGGLKGVISIVSGLLINVFSKQLGAGLDSAITKVKDLGVNLASVVKDKTGGRVFKNITTKAEQTRQQALQELTSPLSSTGDKNADAIIKNTYQAQATTQTKFIEQSKHLDDLHKQMYQTQLDELHVQEEKIRKVAEETAELSKQQAKRDAYLSKSGSIQNYSTVMASASHSGAAESLLDIFNENDLSITKGEKLLEERANIYSEYLSKYKAQLEEGKSSLENMFGGTVANAINEFISKASDANERTEAFTNMVDALASSAFDGISGLDQLSIAMTNIPKGINEDEDAFSNFQQAVLGASGSQAELNKAVKEYIAVLGEKGKTITNEQRNAIENYAASLSKSNKEVKEAVNNHRQMGRATQENAQNMENLNKKVSAFQEAVDQAAKKQMTFGEGVSALARAMTSFNSLISSISNLFEKLNDGNASAVEIISALVGVLTTAGMVLSSIVPVVALFNRKLDETAGKLIFTQSVALPLLAALAAIAVIIGAVLIIKQIKSNSLEGRLEAASKAASELKSSLDEAKQSAEELNQTVTKYNTAVDALESCKKGTEEWNEKLKEVNTSVSELLEKYPDLAKYLYRDENGVLKIEQKGIDELIAETNQRQVASQYAYYTATRNRNDLQITKDTNTAKANLLSQNSYNDAAWDTGEVLNTIKQLYAENGKDVSNITPEAFSAAFAGIDQARIDAAYKILQQYKGKTGTNALDYVKFDGTGGYARIEDALGFYPGSNTNTDNAIKNIIANNADAIISKYQTDGMLGAKNYVRDELLQDIPLKDAEGILKALFESNTDLTSSIQNLTDTIDSSEREIKNQNDLMADTITKNAGFDTSEVSSFMGDVFGIMTDNWKNSQLYKGENALKLSTGATAQDQGLEAYLDRWQGSLWSKQVNDTANSFMKNTIETQLKSGSGYIYDTVADFLQGKGSFSDLTYKLDNDTKQYYVSYKDADNKEQKIWASQLEAFELQRDVQNEFLNGLRDATRILSRLGDDSNVKNFIQNRNLYNNRQGELGEKITDKNFFAQYGINDKNVVSFGFSSLDELTQEYNQAIEDWFVEQKKFFGETIPSLTRSLYNYDGNNPNNLINTTKMSLDLQEQLGNWISGIFNEKGLNITTQLMQSIFGDKNDEEQAKLAQAFSSITDFSDLTVGGLKAKFNELGIELEIGDDVLQQFCDTVSKATTDLDKLSNSYAAADKVLSKLTKGSTIEQKDYEILQSTYGITEAELEQNFVKLMDGTYRFIGESTDFIKNSYQDLNNQRLRGAEADINRSTAISDYLNDAAGQAEMKSAGQFISWISGEDLSAENWIQTNQDKLIPMLNYLDHASEALNIGEGVVEQWKASLADETLTSEQVQEIVDYVSQMNVDSLQLIQEASEQEADEILKTYVVNATSQEDLEERIANVKEVMGEAYDTTQLYELGLRSLTSVYDMVAKKAQTFAESIGKQGSLNGDQLKALKELDPNAIDNYLTMSSSEWDEYAYNQAMAYYDKLAEDYKTDKEMFIQVLQEKREVQSQYYEDLEKRLVEAAEREEEAWTTAIQNIEDALSELSNLKPEDNFTISSYEAIEKMRQAIIKAGYDWQEFEDLLSGKDKTNKQAIVDYANAKTALLLSRQLQDQAQLNNTSGMIFKVTPDIQSPAIEDENGNVTIKTANPQATYEVNGLKSSIEQLPAENGIIHLENLSADAEYEPKLVGTGEGAEKKLVSVSGDTITLATAEGDAKIVVAKINKSNGLTSVDVNETTGAVTFNGSGSGSFTVDKLDGKVITDKGDGKYELKPANGSASVTVDLIKTGAAEWKDDQVVLKDGTGNAVVTVNDINSDPNSNLNIEQTDNGYTMTGLNGLANLSVAVDPNSESNFGVIVDKNGDVSIKQLAGGNVINLGLNTDDFKNAEGIEIDANTGAVSLKRLSQDQILKIKGKYDGVIKENDDGTITLLPFEIPEQQLIINVKYKYDDDDLTDNMESQIGSSNGSWTPSFTAIGDWQNYVAQHTENGTFTGSAQEFFGSDTNKARGIQHMFADEFLAFYPDEIEDNKEQLISLMNTVLELQILIEEMDENAQHRDLLDLLGLNTEEDIEKVLNVLFFQVEGGFDQLNKNVALSLWDLVANNKLDDKWLEKFFPKSDPNSIKNFVQKVFGGNLTKDMLLSLDTMMKDSNGKATEAGKYIILGLLKGLGEDSDAVKAFLEAVGYDSIEALEVAWDEHSPSKVAYRIGAYFMEGLHNGLQDEEGAIVKEIGEFAKQVVEQAEKAFDGKDIDINTNLWSGMKDSDFELSEDDIKTIRSHGKFKGGYKKADGTMQWLDEIFETQEEAEEAARQEALEAVKQMFGTQATGIADYVAGGFWDDKGYSSSQKLVLDEIFKDALKKAGLASDITQEELEKWLSKDASNEDKLLREISAAYTRKKDYLKGALNLDWARIKDNYVEMMNELYDFDKAQAEKTYENWKKAWEAIGKLRLAALGADAEDKSVAETLGSADSISAFIRQQMGEGTDISELVALAEGTVANANDKNALNLTLNSGNRVFGRDTSFLNYDSNGRLINTTLDEYKKNAQNSMLGLYSSSSDIARVFGELTGAELAKYETAEALLAAYEIDNATVEQKEALTKYMALAENVDQSGFSSNMTLDQYFAQLPEMLSKKTTEQWQAEMDEAVSIAVGNQAYAVSQYRSTITSEAEAKNKVRETYAEILGKQIKGETLSTQDRKILENTSALGINDFDTMSEVQRYRALQEAQVQDQERAEMLNYATTHGYQLALEGDNAGKLLDGEGNVVDIQSAQFLKNLQLLGFKSSVGQEDANRNTTNFLASAVGMSVDDFKEYTQLIKEQRQDLKLTDKEYETLAFKAAKAQKGIASLAKVSKDTWKTLKNDAKKGTSEYASGMEQLKKGLSDALLVDESKISNKFIEEHFDEIEALANGTEKEAKKAMTKLQQDFAIETINAEDFKIENKEAFAQQLRDFVEANSDQDPITFSVSVDDSDFVGTLQTMLASGQMTVDQINDTLNQIGYEPQITWQDMTVADAVKQGYSYASLAGANLQYTEADLETNQQTTVRVPIIGKVTKLASPPPKSSSGGGGGARKKDHVRKDPRQYKRPEDEIDRYHHIKKTLESLEHEYTMIDKAKNKAFGADKLKAIDNEIKKTKELYNAQKEYVKQIEANLPKDQVAIASYGATFDEKGNISNYEELRQKYIDEWNQAYDRFIDEQNAAVDKFNASARGDADEEIFKEEDELAKAHWEAAQDAYEEFNKTLDQYEETINELDKAREEELDKLFQWRDEKLEKITTTVELNIEIGDNVMAVLEELLDQLGDKADRAADRIANFGSQTEIAFDKMKAYRAGLANIFRLEADAETYWTQDENSNPVKTNGPGQNEGFIDRMINGTITDEDRAYIDQLNMQTEDVDKLEGWRDELLSLNKDLRELRQNALEEVTKAFEEYTGELERNTEQIQHLQTVTQTYNDIVGIVGKRVIDQSGNLTKFLAKANYDLQRNNTASVKAELLFIDNSIRDVENQIEELNKLQAEGYDEAMPIKDLEEQLKGLTDTRNSTYENWLQAWQDECQAAADIFSATMEAIVDNFEQTLAGSFGTLSALQEEYDRKKTIDDVYLDEYAQIYNLSKLTRDITNSIDETSNVRAKQNLRKLTEEINELQAKGTKLSQYDLDVLQKKYELEMARYQLDEAREQKTEVRMVRDSEGNFGYVYTANAQAVQEAQDNYEQKLYEMQQLNAEYIDNMQSQILQVQSECSQALANLNASDYATYEEYQQAALAIQQDYGQLAQDYYSQLEGAIKNNADLYHDEWEVYSAETGYQLGQEQAFITDFVDTQLARLTGYQSIQNATLTFNEALADAFNDSLKAWNDWYEATQTAMEDGGSSIKDYVDDVTENLVGDKGILEQAQHASALAEEQRLAFDDSFDNIVDKLDEFLQKWNDSIENAIDLNTQLASKISDAITEHIKKTTDSENIEYDESIITAKSAVVQGDTVEVKKYDVAGPVDKKESENPASSDITAPSNSGYDTGGYTGSWGTSDGKLAILHQKELVLNAKDTENMLDAVNIIRDISNGIDLNSAVASNGLSGALASAVFAQAPAQDTIEQNVQITAEFKDATTATEITSAFETLINRASQYANRK